MLHRRVSQQYMGFATPTLCKGRVPATYEGNPNVGHRAVHICTQSAHITVGYVCGRVDRIRCIDWVRGRVVHLRSFHATLPCPLVQFFNVEH